MITMPIMVFVVLGALQIMLIEHARIMTEYAAYNAARAGIVHDANWNVMRNAALISVLPLYGRTDTIGQFMLMWLKVKAAAEITEAVDTGVATLERMGSDLLGVSLSGLVADGSLIEIQLDSPTDKAFKAWGEWVQARQSDATRIDSANGALKYPTSDHEIDFDDVEFYKWAAARDPTIQPGRLGVEVRVLYPLKIPLVNKIIFELWLAQLTLNAKEVRSDITEWAQFQGHLRTGETLDQVLDAPAPDLGEFFTERQWAQEIDILRLVAKEYGVYLLPLRATYGMQMQSNMFESTRREPVWFTVGGSK